MRIALLPEHEKLIADKIASGMYVTGSEVVRDALRHVAALDPLIALRVDDARLRARLEKPTRKRRRR